MSTIEDDFHAIKSMYQDEINAYKVQIEQLKTQNKNADEKNNGLIAKVCELQDLIEKANVANQDLHTAFEHVREENMKLQLHSGNQDSNVVRPNADEMALETAQRQYVNLARESVNWLSEKDKLCQKMKFLERECERYTRDNMTLGKQVRHLLKSLEEERGMIIRQSSQINDFEEKPVSAEDVIDKHLVTFESIEQLQQQNQKLVSLVKELSKKEEERELQVENEDIIRLNKDIEELKLQLEGVKDDRERIMNSFNTILKERDLFKILLCKTRQVEHMTPEVFQRMVSIACSSGMMMIDEPENTQDKDAHIVDLKAMIAKLENNISELRNDLETSRKRSEEEIKLKTELLEKAHLKILSGSKQLEVVIQRNQLLESNIKSVTDEFDEARTKSQKLAFEVEQIKKENQHLVEAIEQEKQRRQSELTTILNEIQSKSDLRFELQLKLTQAENELKNLNSHIDHLELRLKDSNTLVQDLQQEIERLNEENQRFKSEIESLKTAITSSQSCATDVRESHSEIKRLMNIVEESNSKIQNLEVEAMASQNRIISLQEELKRSLSNKAMIAEQYNSKIKGLQDGIDELSRLRNLERNGRLDLMKKYFVLSKKSGGSSKIPRPKVKIITHQTMSSQLPEAPSLEEKIPSVTDAIILQRLNPHESEDLSHEVIQAEDVRELEIPQAMAESNFHQTNMSVNEPDLSQLGTEEHVHPQENVVNICTNLDDKEISEPMISEAISEVKGDPKPSETEPDENTNEKTPSEVVKGIVLKRRRIV